MSFNSTTAILGAFQIDPTEHYRSISHGFGECHLDPVNVALHFLTTPLGMIGAFSMLYSYTKSSSIAITVMSVYLLSLLPAVPNGVFAGTAFLCAVIVFLASKWKVSFLFAIGMIVCGYMLQDMSHLATGERTFQASYSNGGHVSNSPCILLHCIIVLFVQSNIIMCEMVCVD